MSLLIEPTDLLSTMDLAIGLELDAEAEPELPDPLDMKLVCPFRVVVDTREQAPFHFLNIDPFSIVFLTTNVALQTGDYSISGLEDRVTIERKSISDLLGSITAGRSRFEREFERMAEMARHPLGGFACVVVEGELSEVCRHVAEKTRLSTDSLLGTIDSWSIRYGVHWRFCPGRRFAEIATLKILCQFWRNNQKRVKELNQQGKAVIA